MDRNYLKKLLITSLMLTSTSMFAKLSGEYQETSDTSFDTDILTANKNSIVVAKFYATWCEVSAAFAPIFQKFSTDHPDNSVIFVNVDVDKNSETSAIYGIQGVPTIIFFQNSQIKAQHAGMADEKTLNNILTCVQGGKQPDCVQGADATAPKSTQHKIEGKPLADAIKQKAHAKKQARKAKTKNLK